jgi:hypothetical protein
MSPRSRDCRLEWLRSRFARLLPGFLSAVVPDRFDSRCNDGHGEMTLYFET